VKEENGREGEEEGEEGTEEAVSWIFRTLYSPIKNNSFFPDALFSLKTGNIRNCSLPPICWFFSIESSF